MVRAFSSSHLRQTLRLTAVTCALACTLASCSADSADTSNSTAPAHTAAVTTPTPGSTTGATTGSTVEPQPTTATAEPLPSVATTDVPPEVEPTAVTNPLDPPPSFVDSNGFNDHTVPRLASISEFETMARGSINDQRVVKFAIPNLAQPGVHWFDSNFYSLHDEWYWFRLLNGQRVPGSDTAPFTARRFASIRQIYDWAEAQPANGLPLDLQWAASRTGDRRLYSNAFYNLALHADPRAYGIGTLIRFPDRDRTVPDHWLIELEFGDAVTADELEQFFTRLGATLPAPIAEQLFWVVRSPVQESLARSLERAGDPLAERTVRWSDLVPPGASAVYSPGVSAGRLLYVAEDGAALSESTDNDIIVTEHVPDVLPAARGLITSNPQTPLAHVNLLARNRGIPNVSINGVHLDPTLRQAARVRAPVALRANPDGTVAVALITEAQYRTWRDSTGKPATAVPAVTPTAMPYVFDLALAARRPPSENDLDRLRPMIGGKSAGFLSLLSTPFVTAPPEPLAVTVRAYFEHLETLRPRIVVALNDPAFRQSARVRWLVLEGAEDYAEVFGDRDDADFATEFLNAHPPSSPLGGLIVDGGIRGLVASTPIQPSTLTSITNTLTTRFGHYAATTGLRFRSSSSVEDIEGFNGAGLYTSYTGYLDAAAQTDPDDRDNTVERALARAWGSYWGFEAFEERRLEGIDHLTGGMGVTVHARFDDDLERNNGVATYTFVPGGSRDDAVIEINVQLGATPVTNPDPAATDLPEVLRVKRDGDGAFIVERVSRSTLSPATDVFSDDEAKQLAAQLDAVARAWRLRINTPLPAERRVEVVVLDFEFKTVAAGWPALRAGPQHPARLVVRQVRSLDPGVRHLPATARSLAAPLDVLSRARSIDTVRCPGETEPAAIVLTTDPLATPDMGFSVVPLVTGDRASLSDPACERQALYRSPDEFLLDVFDDPSTYVVGG